MLERDQPPSHAKGGTPLLALIASSDLREALSAAAKRPPRVMDTAEQLLAALGENDTTNTIVVIDGATNDLDDLLRKMKQATARNRCRVILIDAAPDQLQDGADVTTTAASLSDAVQAMSNSTQPRPIPDLDRVLQASLLGAALEPSLAAAADDVAAGFDVDGCLISVRGEYSGGGTNDRTWSSMEWIEAASCCRSSTRSGATVIAPRQLGRSAGSSSYIAVPMDSPFGTDGFIGLVVERPHVFSRSDRNALFAIAHRFAAELSWRSVHDRLVEEFDRSALGPGLDRVLGTWNRPALEQLTAMHLASARRTGTPLSAAVFDVVNLQGINNSHGLKIGDALLRRLADAVRAQIREEDTLGRWAGDEIAVLFNGIEPETARRAVERLLKELRKRPLDLGGRSVELAVSAGVAAAQPEESVEQFLSRAAVAARQAQDNGIDIARAAQSSPASPSPQQDMARDIGSTTLGGTFRLLHEISGGGMGVVYRGEDLALERPVAIKMLRPDLGVDKEFTERFRREAAMLAHLRHPNLVQVYSFGTTEGESYFVMELVEGESLEQAIERGRLEGSAMSLWDLASVVEQIASALSALHERGIVHRDVKPANVIIDPFQARAVLVDVGIAHQHEQQRTIAGTPGFVAPEVIAGGEATARSDVYGLAATAYATLTLSQPWPGRDPMAVMAAQRQGNLRPPSELRPELALIDEIILAAMSVDPANRPESAEGFASVLVANLAQVVGPRREPDGRVREPTGKGPRLRRAHDTSDARTRGVVFRSVARAIGVRQAERLRDAIGGDHAELARALSHDTAPLTWLPTDLFIDLLRVAPEQMGCDPLRFANDIARSAVRASFRRFFPASAATLVPENTLSAIGRVWGRYQSWGSISSMPVHGAEVVVRLTEKPTNPSLCQWTSGLLEQLVVLAGGGQASVQHHACESRGDSACLFRASWTRS